MPELIGHTPVASMEQVHGNRCQIVTDATTHRVANVDALVTTEMNLTLLVRIADCLPILLYHPQGVIGVIHAGRKGTELGIVRETLRLVQRHYGVTQEIILWLGPGICENCYQINPETDRHFDLITENANQASEVFASDKIKILATPHCTYHEPEYFYSYRREGPGVAMNYAGIRLTAPVLNHDQL